MLRLLERLKESVLTAAKIVNTFICLRLYFHQGCLTLCSTIPSVGKDLLS